MREGEGKRERARRSSNSREGWKAGKGLSPNPVREGEAGERGLDGAPTSGRDGGREGARAIFSGPQREKPMNQQIKHTLANN